MCLECESMGKASKGNRLQNLGLNNNFKGSDKKKTALTTAKKKLCCIKFRKN